jgi:hypothetical protein
MGRGAAEVQAWAAKVHKFRIDNTSQGRRGQRWVDVVDEWMLGWPSPWPLRLIMASERLVRPHHRSACMGTTVHLL